RVPAWRWRPASGRHPPYCPTRSSALGLARVTATRVRVLLADRAVLLLDHVLDISLGGHLPACGLRLSLGVVRRAGTLIALRTVLPLTVLVVRLDITLRHAHDLLGCLLVMDICPGRCGGQTSGVRE